MDYWEVMMVMQWDLMMDKMIELVIVMHCEYSLLHLKVSMTVTGWN